MPLPKIATPTYELKLPSTGKPVKYRPFLVKEDIKKETKVEVQHNLKSRYKG